MATEDDSSGSSGLWGVLGAGLLGGLASYKGSEKTNETNLELGREQMKFQERMSNSAYQRAVADMKAAGINPMLASKVGGASTPTGNLPQVENAIGAGVSGAVQGAGMMTAAQQIMQSKAQTDNIAATTDKIKSETMEKTLNSAKLQWELERLKGDTKQSAYDAYRKEEEFRAMNEADDKGRVAAGFRADVDRRKAEAAQARFGVDEARVNSEFYRNDWGADSPYIKQIIDIIRGISSARGALR